MPSSNWATGAFRRAFQKTFTNVFQSRGVSTRRRRSRRPAQQISLESLEPRQMLSINTVTTNADFGAGSLRQAIIDANATSANDEIVFAASLFTNGANTITLGSAALPTIAATSSAGSLAITGPGASSLTIDANGGNFSILVANFSYYIHQNKNCNFFKLLIESNLIENIFIIFSQNHELVKKICIFIV